MAEAQLLLVVGGARSGKSTFAEELALRHGGKVVYVATMQRRCEDEEMVDRIAKHQERRPPHWQTVEEPMHLAATLKGLAGKAEVILIDCMTVYVSNLILAYTGDLAEHENPELPAETEAKILAQAATVISAAKASQALVIFVSNETGAGVVPAYSLGRLFRDVNGRVNQMLAAAAHEVFFLQFGLAQRLKTEAITAEQVVRGLRR